MLVPCVSLQVCPVDIHTLTRVCPQQHRAAFCTLPVHILKMASSQHVKSFLELPGGKLEAFVLKPRTGPVIFGTYL